MRYSSPNQRFKSMRRQRCEQNGKSGHSAWLCPCITLSQIGQRTLIIGLLGLGLGRFFFGFCAACRSRLLRRGGCALLIGCAVALGRGGLVSRRRRALFLIRLGGRL